MEFLNTPWSTTRCWDLVARILSEGRKLEDADDARFATYDIAVGTEAIEQLDMKKNEALLKERKFFRGIPSSAVSPSVI